jgi:hypothetical protein
MKKVIIVVLALAIIWAIPPIRNRLGLVALPLLEKLGPVGEKMANPVRGFRAKNELAFFLRILHDDHTEGRQLPDERAFLQWVRRRMPEESGIDPWGNSYWLRRSGRTYTAGSNGPDGARDTGDDLTQALTI